MAEPTPAAAPPPRFLERLGTRAAARAAPRLTIALAAAGCALVILGTLVVGGDGLAGGGGGSRLPGLLLTAAVVSAGFAVLARVPAGPLATAASVAAALGIPPLLFFLTFDDGNGPPYDTEVILYVSTAAWAVSYVAGPARGRPLFLGLAAIGLWASVLQTAEEVFTFPFGLGFFVPASGSESFDGGFGIDAPDPATIGGLSLAFGAAYVYVARRWDRAGFAGAATPITVAALLVLPFGVAFLADELEPAGTGMLGAAVGAAVAAHGASVARRATTWFGAAGVAVGLLTFVGDLVDEATPGGVALMVTGGAVIAGAEALRRSTGEPDEHPAPREPA